MRIDNRSFDELRQFSITKWEHSYAESAVLVSFGNTKVICTAYMEDSVPPFLKGKASGWLTAEYNMLPMSCPQRIARKACKGKQTGRTQEIQRIIGRSLRTAVNLGQIGERTITIDCDVIQADAGTRTASITGGFVALAMLLKKRKLSHAVNFAIAGISLGVVNNELLLDLNYEEDSTCDSDINLVFNDKYDIIECVASSERAPISSAQFLQAIELAKLGIKEIFIKQKLLLNETN